MYLVRKIVLDKYQKVNKYSNTSLSLIMANLLKSWSHYASLHHHFLHFDSHILTLYFFNLTVTTHPVGLFLFCHHPTHARPSPFILLRCTFLHNNHCLSTSLLPCLSLSLCFWLGKTAVIVKLNIHPFHSCNFAKENGTADLTDLH